MNPTVELVLKHKKANMRKLELLMLEALKSAPQPHPNEYINPRVCTTSLCVRGSHMRKKSFLECLSSIYLHMGICIWGFAHILHTRNLHTGIPICKNA
jgi:hypothetical protein